MNDPKVFKLGVGNDLGVLYKWYYFGVQRSKVKVTRRINAHSKCPISSEREGLRSSNLVHRRSTKTRISDKRRDLQGQRSRLQGHVTRLLGVGR